MERMRNRSIRKRLMAALLALTVIASAATAVTLTLWDETEAASTLTPGTAEYYDARWEEAKEEAGNLEAGTAYTNYSGDTSVTAVEGPWMLEDLDTKYEDDEISAPWNGNARGTQPTRGAGTTNNPYLVYTAEDFRYCIVNRSSCTLMNDIDLGGYLGNIWTTVEGSGSRAWVIDGNGHVVYNYYFYNSRGNSVAYAALLGHSQNNMTVKDLKISNSYIRLNGLSASGYAAFLPVLAATLAFQAVPLKML